MFLLQPTLLVDTVRLLTHRNSPRNELVNPANRKAIINVLVAHLSHLLFSPDAIAYSRDPPSPKAGAHYDTKIAVLAAYLDDARLVGRVANRARLRLPKQSRKSGLMGGTRDVRDVHSKLVQGLAYVKFRPYSLLAPPVARGPNSRGSAHGYALPFQLLGV